MDAKQMAKLIKKNTEALARAPKGKNPRNYDATLPVRVEDDAVRLVLQRRLDGVLQPAGELTACARRGLTTLWDRTICSARRGRSARCSHRGGCHR